MTFPEPGSGADTVPVPGPEDPRSPYTRTYTPRRFDPATQTLEVDFALHGPGPAATWAEQAKVGQQLILMGPAPGYAVDTEAPWYVILGDDAALPAVETILEALPAATKTTVLLEVVAADEARPLAGPAQTDVRWLGAQSGRRARVPRLHAGSRASRGRPAPVACTSAARRPRCGSCAPTSSRRRASIGRASSRAATGAWARSTTPITTTPRTSIPITFGGQA